MGKKSPKAPAAPDPVATAAAQTQQNKDTAYWNAVLNNVNQVTPYGTLTYTQTGGGKTYNDAGYNAAMQNYNNALASGGQGGQITRFGKPTTDFSYKDGGYWNNVTNRAVNPAQVMAMGLSGGGSNYIGTMPKREDFYTGETPPQFTSTINLTPEQQAILDTQTRSEQALATLGEEQLGRIRGAVSTPFSFSGLPGEFTAEDAATAAARGEEALMSRLNPQFSRDEEALRTRLINQGIGQGSDAYNREMERFNQAQTDARMQAILQGANYGGTMQNQALQRRQQGINEYTTQRNAPLNEYIGLTSGVQVQNPQFQNTGYQGTAPVDYAGLVNNQYQAQLGQYNSKVASNNATQSALFGLGGSALASAGGTGGWLALLSDIRAKENINKIGSMPSGIGVYEYNYIGDNTPRIGVIAQEVEKIIPDAVITGDDGFKRVYYEMVR